MHAVDRERCRFQQSAGERTRAKAERDRLRHGPASNRTLCVRVRTVQPRQGQVLHIRLVDLRQRAVVASRIVPVIRRPRIDGRFADQCGIELRLRMNEHTQGRGANEDEEASQCHLNPTDTRSRCACRRQSTSGTCPDVPSADRAHGLSGRRYRARTSAALPCRRSTSRKSP